MDTIAVLLLVGLAVWRVSSIITDEEGPFNIFKWGRAQIDRIGAEWLSAGVRCVWCVSFWVGGGAALALWAGSVTTEFWVPFWALAFSSVSVLVDRAVVRE